MVLIHEDLSKDEITLRTLLNIIPDSLFHITSEGILLGYKNGSGMAHLPAHTMIGKNLLDTLPPAISQQLRDAIQHIQQTGDIQSFEYRLQVEGVEYIRKARIAATEKGEFLCLLHDVTDHKKMQQTLDESEHRFRAMAENASDLVLILDATGTYRYASPSHQRILGYAPEELMGTSIFNLFSTEDMAKAVATFSDALKTHELVRHRCRLRHANGSYIIVEYVGHSCFDDPAIEGFVINARDVTEQVVLENKLRQQASHDTLTNLPNRTLLLKRLEQAIQARGAERVALLTMDLDRFKEINDTFGHHRGDVLLQQVAQRLLQAVNTTATVARLGGDEFAILLPTDNEQDVQRIASLVRETFEEHFMIEEMPLQVQASIGAALYPEHGTDALTLLRRADVAMYTAKQTRRDYALYDASQDHYSPRRLALIGALRHAIANNELRLYYQPKVELRTGQVHSVEALVRWQHPEFGFVPPDQFIPLAEQTGLILPLSLWVLETAVQQCKNWLDMGRDLSIAVNLSTWDLREPTLPDTIAGLLKRYAVPSHLLRVELTESAVMTDIERVLEVLKRLSTLGIHIAVDDFGTGYSSLAYLKRLPIHELKIDRSFIQHMSDVEVDATIVRSTVMMAHSLGLQVVAEGVEDEKTWRLLSRFHCDIAQGYYMSRPVTAQDLECWLNRLKGV